MKDFVVFLVFMRKSEVKNFFFVNLEIHMSDKTIRKGLTIHWEILESYFNTEALYSSRNYLKIGSVLNLVSEKRLLQHVVLNLIQNEKILKIPDQDINKSLIVLELK